MTSSSTTIRSAFRLQLLALIAAVMVLMAPSAAGAADNGSFGVNPAGGAGTEPRSYFIYNLDPGANIEDAVVVSNSTDAPMTFKLYAADATPAVDGAFALGKAEDEPTGVGSWVLLPTNEITIPANTQANVPFRLIVPSNALPGDHAGGIVALDTKVSPGEDQGGLAIGTQNSVGARIYVRVSGPTQPSVDVTAVSLTTERTVGSLFGAPSTSTVTYKIANTGNVRLAPTVSVTVKGPLGLGSGTAPQRELPELLPGSSASITETVDGPVTIGWQTATVDGTAAAADGSTGSSSGSTRALTIPWGVVAVVIAALVAFAVLRRRRKRPSSERLLESADGGGG
jgi:hypothetical protein